jgi:aminoglycoside 6-adenylyltransferase
MFDLILGVAQGDDRVRAVAMNGSRTNPNAPRDIFQDYDIVYLVTNVDSMLSDTSWLDVFGELMIIQTPATMELVPPAPDQNMVFLMQFMDGTRIDLTLLPVEDRAAYAYDDKLTMILLDKDNCMPKLPAPTDSDYWAKPPTAKWFDDCCNEFWWLAPYVAKGLWRQEILYAKRHLDLERNMLMKMLEFQVGMENDFGVSIGKAGKYMKRYLSDQDWQDLLETYPEGTYESTWNSFFRMHELFRRCSRRVAERFGFDYPEQWDRRVSAYVERIHDLPADATTI